MRALTIALICAIAGAAVDPAIADDGIGTVLGDFVDRGEWSESDAIRVAELVGRDNALRVYALEG